MFPIPLRGSEANCIAVSGESILKSSGIDLLPGSIVRSKPWEGSAVKASRSLRARPMPSFQGPRRVGVAQARSSSGCSPGCAWASPSLSVIGSISAAGCPWGSPRSLRAYRRCLLSNRASAGSRAASLISGPNGVDFSMPVTARAWLLIRPCSPSRQFFCPCHQSSAP